MYMNIDSNNQSTKQIEEPRWKEEFENCEFQAKAGGNLAIWHGITSLSPRGCRGVGRSFILIG
jgi:hypothetical protein